jgi:hypothetical protein
MTTPHTSVPRSITEYRTITASPVRHEDWSTRHDSDVRIVQEYRGRRRSLVTLGRPGVEQAPRVSVHYPGVIRSPEAWMALLPAAEHLEGPALLPKTWPALSDGTEDDWRRRLVAVASHLRVPRSEDPNGDGLSRTVERAAYALLGVMLHDPAPAVVRPTGRFTAVDSTDGQRCPAWAGSARWARRNETQAVGSSPQRPCGCDGDSPCLWAWAEMHYPENPPARDWDTLRLLVADSPLIKAVRALGVPQQAQNAAKADHPARSAGYGPGPSRNGASRAP